jgi:pyridoxine/pyridoxamine 5'-phosphate oxidase
MHETPDELAALDRLLTESLHRSTEHLRSIVTEGERTLDAAETCRVLTGMRTLALATVTAGGEPRISGVDGHFLHGRWVFTTSGTSAKARHLRSRPAVSVAHIVGDDLGVFCHGQVEELTEQHPDRAAVEAHLTEHYGSSPSSWGPEILYARVQPHWMVTYAFARDRVLSEADAAGETE